MKAFLVAMVILAAALFAGCESLQSPAKKKEMDRKLREAAFQRPYEGWWE